MSSKLSHFKKMSNPVKIRKKYFEMSSAEKFTQSAINRCSKINM